MLYRRLHNADDEDDDEREVEAREMRKKVKAKRVGEDTYKGEEMAGLGSGFLPPISPKGSGFSPQEDLVRALKIGKDSQLGDMHYKYIHYHPSIARKTALNIPESLIMPRREGFTFESSASLKKEDTLFAMQMLSDASYSKNDSQDSHMPSIELACFVYTTAARIRSHLAGPVLKYKPNKAEKSELDRMDALFAHTARPLCVFPTSGKAEAQTNHASESLQSLWQKYQEAVYLEEFDLLSYASKRGE